MPSSSRTALLPVLQLLLQSLLEARGLVRPSLPLFLILPCSVLWSKWASHKSRPRLHSLRSKIGNLARHLIGSPSILIFPCPSRHQFSKHPNSSHLHNSSLVPRRWPHSLLLLLQPPVSHNSQVKLQLQLLLLLFTTLFATTARSRLLAFATSAMFVRTLICARNVRIEAFMILTTQ